MAEWSNRIIQHNKIRQHNLINTLTPSKKKPMRKKNVAKTFAKLNLHMYNYNANDYINFTCRAVRTARMHKTEKRFES